MRKLGLILIVLGCTSLAQAQTVRPYSDEFLSIGVGARALGMAGSIVASDQDVTAGYWNPAGLVYVDNLQIAAMHSEYFAGISDFDYGAVAIPLKNDRVIGFSIVRFGTDDIPNTLFLVQPDGSIDYTKVTTFSAADYGFLFSYAQKFKKIEGLSIGGNAKVIYRLVGSFANCWGFGFDLGAQYHIKNNLELGLIARDITTTFNAWSFNFTDAEQNVLASTGNEIPTSSIELTAPTVIIGGAYKIPIGKFGILPEANFNVTTDGQRNVLISAKPFSIDPHAGIEFSYNNLVFIRGGIGNIQTATDDVSGKTIHTAQPDIGIGLRLGAFTLDYAFTDLGNVSEAPYSNVFSLKLDLNRKKQSE